LVSDVLKHERMGNTNMLYNSDVSSPNSNLAKVNHNGFLLDTEDGIYLDELPVGAVIEVDTDHRTYLVENRGDGRALIAGHPDYCPEPVLVDLLGSTMGGAMLKMRFIGPGRKMEFRHPVRGLVCTSRVRELHARTLAH
jgi:hypothetical protein